MINRADILSRSYGLPQVQPVSPQPVGYQGQPQPFDDGLTYDTGIASIQGATEDYYKKIGMLKSFMQEAQTNYGIDVRIPDYSKPVSIRLNQMYQKALADIKSQGNLLKNSQSQFAATNYGQNVAFVGNADPTKQAMAGMRPGVDYVNKDIHPLINEANQKLQQQFYGKSYDQAVQIYNKTKSDLQEYAKNNPQEAAAIQRSLNALAVPTKSEKEFAPRDPSQEYSKTDRAKIKAAELAARKVANIMAGTTEGFKLKTDEKGANGETLYVNTDLKGTNYGDGQIVETVYNPTTKSSLFRVKKSDGTITSVDLAGMDVVTVMKELASKNPRFAAAGEYVDLWAGDSGLASDTGEITADKLVDSSRIDATNKKFQEQANAKDAKDRDARLTNVEKLLTKLEPRLTWATYKLSSGEDFKLPNGSVLNVKRSDDDEFTITNFSEVFPTAPKNLKDKYNGKKLPLSEVMKIMRKYDAAPVSETPETTTSTSATQPTSVSSGTPSAGKVVPLSTVKGLVGKPGYEGYTEQELIDYYKGQGYTIQ